MHGGYAAGDRLRTEPIKVYNCALLHMVRPLRAILATQNYYHGHWQPVEAFAGCVECSQSRQEDSNLNDFQIPFPPPPKSPCHKRQRASPRDAPKDSVGHNTRVRPRVNDRIHHAHSGVDHLDQPAQPEDKTYETAPNQASHKKLTPSNGPKSKQSSMLHLVSVLAFALSGNLNIPSTEAAWTKKYKTKLRATAYRTLHTTPVAPAAPVVSVATNLGTSADAPLVPSTLNFLANTKEERLLPTYPIAPVTKVAAIATNIPGTPSNPVVSTPGVASQAVPTPASDSTSLQSNKVLATDVTPSVLASGDNLPPLPLNSATSALSSPPPPVNATGTVVTPGLTSATSVDARATTIDTTTGLATDSTTPDATTRARVVATPGLTGATGVDAMATTTNATTGLATGSTTTHATTSAAGAVAATPGLTGGATGVDAMATTTNATTRLATGSTTTDAATSAGALATPGLTGAPGVVDTMATTTNATTTNVTTGLATDTTSTDATTSAGGVAPREVGVTGVDAMATTTDTTTGLATGSTTTDATTSAGAVAPPGPTGVTGVDAMGATTGLATEATAIDAITTTPNATTTATATAATTATGVLTGSSVQSAPSPFDSSATLPPGEGNTLTAGAATDGTMGDTSMTLSKSTNGTSALISLAKQYNMTWTNWVGKSQCTGAKKCIGLAMIIGLELYGDEPTNLNDVCVAHLAGDVSSACAMWYAALGNVIHLRHAAVQKAMADPESPYEFDILFLHDETIAPENLALVHQFGARTMQIPVDFKRKVCTAFAKKNPTSNITSAVCQISNFTRSEMPGEMLFMLNQLSKTTVVAMTDYDAIVYNDLDAALLGRKGMQHTIDYVLKSPTVEFLVNMDRFSPMNGGQFVVQPSQ
eukprot:797243-Amorphochlora_amoeboformis.AAC.1